MKKVLVFISVLFFILPVFAEPVIIDWLGSDVTDEAYPKWLESLDNDDEGIVRKKFNIPKTDRIFLGYAEDVNFDTAKIKAKMDSHKEIDMNKTISSSEFVTAYWILIFDEELEETKQMYYEYYYLIKMSEVK